MNNEIIKTKNKFSKKQLLALVLFSVIFATIINNCSNSNDIPAGLGKSFYYNATDIYLNLEDILWNNSGPLDENQQQWLETHIYSLQNESYTNQEIRVKNAFKNYITISLMAPLENQEDDQKWYAEYLSVKKELRSSLGIN